MNTELKQSLLAFRIIGIQLPPDVAFFGRRQLSQWVKIKVPNPQPSIHVFD